MAQSHPGPYPPRMWRARNGAGLPLTGAQMAGAFLYETSHKFNFDLATSLKYFAHARKPFV